jgi:diguanylate cyclase (GGDEF)-like protein
VPYRGFVMRILQPDESPTTHYLRLETTSTSLLVPRLYSPEQFLEAVGADYGFQLATLGAVLVVLLLNAVAWWWVRDPLAPWFMAFMAALALNIAGNADIPAQYLWPASSAIPDAWTRMASLLSIAAGNAFYQRLFGVDRGQPALHGVYLAASVVPLAGLPAAFAGYYPETMRLMLPMVLAMNVVGLVLAARQWRERRPGSGFVLAAVGVGFGGLAAFLLVLLGAWADLPVLLYGLQLSSLGSVLALHVALAARTRAAREERGRLDYLAHHDPLTQLPNRTLFFDRVGQAIARARRQQRPFALLLVDLDRFKPVNDTWGHPVGDLVLREAARRMAASVRASDTVGRIGGDEFVALLPDIGTAEAAQGVAAKLRGAVAAPYLVEGRTISIDCCVGIALYPDDGDDEVSLVNNADRAMYDAKRVAPGSVRCFRPPRPAPSGEPA